MFFILIYNFDDKLDSLFVVINYYSKYFLLSSIALLSLLSYYKQISIRNRKNINSLYILMLNV